jgi:hypothetical protein
MKLIKMKNYIILEKTISLPLNISDCSTQALLSEQKASYAVGQIGRINSILTACFYFYFYYLSVQRTFRKRNTHQIFSYHAHLALDARQAVALQ